MLLYKLYADDLKLIADASKSDDIVHDIKLLETWESLWLLNFNVEKCKVMHLKFNGNDSNSYYLDYTALQSIDCEKDLGLITSSDLNWSAHIKNSIKDANRLIA